MTESMRFTTSTAEYEVELDGAVFGVDTTTDQEYWAGGLAYSCTEGKVRWLRWSYEEPELWACEPMAGDERLLAALLDDGAIWDGDQFLALPVDTLRTLEAFLSERVIDLALGR